MLIDGEFRDCAGLPGIEVFDTNTGTVMGSVAEADDGLIGQATAAAARAQSQWWAMTPKARSLALHRVATRLEQADWAELVDVMARELGKPRPEAEGEIEQAIPALRYFAELTRHDQGQVAGETYHHNIHMSRYDPYGVTLHLTPFNYPILLLCWTLGASLGAGNAVVVKPSERATLTTLAFLELFDELPHGLVSCLTGGVAAANALIAHERIAKVAFTGSAAAARAVYQAAAAHMKPVLLEGGGSDALIVTDKVDLDIAAAGAAHGAFYYSGQVCTSIERIFVFAPVYEAFLARLKSHAEALRIGPADRKVDLGPVISAAALARIEAVVADAVARGGRIVTGARRPQGLDGGWFHAPTVIAFDDPATLAGDEIFGPVAMVAPVGSMEEAVRHTNASPFGLGASIFTENLDEAFTAARELDTGMVWINNPLVDNDALPFGGRKASGIGRELGRHGLDEFRQPKMVVVDHRPRLQSWWIPYRYED